MSSKPVTGFKLMIFAKAATSAAFQAALSLIAGAMLVLALWSGPALAYQDCVGKAGTVSPTVFSGDDLGLFMAMPCPTGVFVFDESLPKDQVLDRGFASWEEGDVAAVGFFNAKATLGLDRSFHSSTVTFEFTSDGKTSQLSELLPDPWTDFGVI